MKKNTIMGFLFILTLSIFTISIVSVEIYASGCFKSTTTQYFSTSKYEAGLACRPGADACDEYPAWRQGVYPQCQAPCGTAHSCTLPVGSCSNRVNGQGQIVGRDLTCTGSCTGGCPEIFVGLPPVPTIAITHYCSSTEAYNTNNFCRDDDCSGTEKCDTVTCTCKEKVSCKDGTSFSAETQICEDDCERASNKACDPDDCTCKNEKPCSDELPVGKGEVCIDDCDPTFTGEYECSEDCKGCVKMKEVEGRQVEN